MSCSANGTPQLRRHFLMGGALALAGVPVAAQTGRRLPPADSQADPELDALLERMRKITASRNAAELTALMLPTFRVEFDSGKGPLAFRRHWHLETPASPVWEILGRVLEMQGSFCLPSLYCAPYVYLRFPRDLDPLAHVVSLGSGTVVRDRPAQDASVVGQLDYSIVRLAAPLTMPVVIAGNKFLAIDDPEAGRGYVAGSQVYSPAAHRVFFERRNGKWQWISLAAGTLAEPPELKRHMAKG